MTRLTYVCITSALTLCLGLSAAPKKEATPEKAPNKEATPEKAPKKKAPEKKASVKEATPENPATAIPGTNGIPDLTKGGKLTRLNIEWVGPVGANMASFRPDKQQKATDVRQLMVCSPVYGSEQHDMSKLGFGHIQKGSPADGVLRYHDIILGADGSGAAKVPKFAGSKSAYIEIANAITEAEAHDPAILKLLVWRPANAQTPRTEHVKGEPQKGVKDAPGGYTQGKTMTVTLKLKHYGRYSETAPYNCAKSKKILREGLKALYESNDPGKGFLGALCLLAGDDPSNPDNDKYQARAKEWVYKMVEDKDLRDGPWLSGPRLITLSEYYMKTKDAAVFPDLVKRAEYHANGVSWLGTTGHRFADRQPDGTAGKVTGYGTINCSGVLGFLGLSLARRAGVKSPIVELANKRQRIFFGHYENRGNVIYGECNYGFNGGTGDENGRHAMPALALGLLGKEKKAKYFTRMTALADVKYRYYGHGGPFFAQVWQPLAVAQGGIKANNFYFKEIGWHLDLKRNWDGRRLYEGNPYKGFSRPATALLYYAAPLKQLYVTGRNRDKALELTDAEYAETVATKAFDASKLSDDELIASLSQYLGMLRGVATAELGERVKAAEEDLWKKAIKEGKKRGPEEASEKAKEITGKLIALAGDKRANPLGRSGACRGLIDVKNKARGPLATLMDAEIAKTGVSMLKESDPYIRWSGARILELVPPEDVKPYANDIMDVIIAIDRPTFPLDEENPARWDHGAIGKVFSKQVLSQGVDGLDRKKLVPAIKSMLQTPFSLYRNAAAQGLFNLSKEDTLGIAESILVAMNEGSPFGTMDHVTRETQKLLAKHHFEEGLYLSLLHSPQEAMKDNIPKSYGRAALRTESFRDIAGIIGETMLIEPVTDINRAMPQLIKETGPPALDKMKIIRSVKAAQSTLKLPTAKTELVADAINYALPKAEETTYTWHKVYGAGKVNFSPNGSSGSQKTTVSFVDKKPGIYRFEVTMADTLGINTVSKTVEVTLNGSNGKLPANRPPKATSQRLKAVPGLPTKVVLAGTDPDGDDLGFVITKPPAHGRLTGVGSRLSYIPNFGHPERLAEVPEEYIPGKKDKKDAKRKAKKAKKKGTSPPPSAPDTDKKAKKPEPKKKSNVAVGSWSDSFTFQAIDGQGKTSTGTVTFTISDKDVGVAIYEGFDYPSGTVLGRTDGKSFGFKGPWTLATPKKPKGDAFMVDPKGMSLSYASLPATGGHMAKMERLRSPVRALDPDVLARHKLLDNGQELWFSFFMVPSKGANDKSGFSLFGKDVSLGFRISGSKGELSSMYNGEEVGESRKPSDSRSGYLRGLNKTDEATMFVGRCTWGKTDADVDKLEIFRVFDAPEIGPVFIKNPISVFEQAIPQKDINSISISCNQAADEIRIGTTLHSVLVGTKPLAGK